MSKVTFNKKLVHIVSHGEVAKAFCYTPDELTTTKHVYSKNSGVDTSVHKSYVPEYTVLTVAEDLFICHISLSNGTKVEHLFKLSDDSGASYSICSIGDKKTKITLAPEWLQRIAYTQMMCYSINKLASAVFFNKYRI